MCSMPLKCPKCRYLNCGGAMLHCVKITREVAILVMLVSFFQKEEDCILQVLDRDTVVLVLKWCCNGALAFDSLVDLPMRLLDCRCCESFSELATRGFYRVGYNHLIPTVIFVQSISALLSTWIQLQLKGCRLLQRYDYIEFVMGTDWVLWVPSNMVLDSNDHFAVVQFHDLERVLFTLVRLLYYHEGDMPRELMLTQEDCDPNFFKKLMQAIEQDRNMRRCKEQLLVVLKMLLPHVRLMPPNYRTHFEQSVFQQTTYFLYSVTGCLTPRKDEV